MNELNQDLDGNSPHKRAISIIKFIMPGTSSPRRIDKTPLIKSVFAAVPAVCEGFMCLARASSVSPI